MNEKSGGIFNPHLYRDIYEQLLAKYLQNSRIRRIFMNNYAPSIGNWK